MERSIKTEFGEIDYCIEDGEAYIFDIYVDEQHRRQYNGTYLLRKAIEDMIANGATKIYAEAQTEAGFRLLSKLGFQPTGITTDLGEEMQLTINKQYSDPIILTTSIEEYPEGPITFNGYSQDEKVVLVQTMPFWLGAQEWYEVWFVKERSEVFVDIDDGTTFKIPQLPYEEFLRKSIKELNIEPDETGYGLFVRRVEEDEIIAVHKIVNTEYDVE